MPTTILACLIALAGLVMIAAGAWDLSTLEPDTGEMLQVSDYTRGSNDSWRPSHDRRCASPAAAA